MNRSTTLPETNSKFAPENWWLEDDPFLFGARPIFRGYVSFQEKFRVPKCDDFYSSIPRFLCVTFNTQVLNK